MIVLLFGSLFFAIFSCSKKTCAAYNENQKEEYKMKKNAKHKKARVF